MTMKLMSSGALDGAHLLAQGVDPREALAHWGPPIGFASKDACSCLVIDISPERFVCHATSLNGGPWAIA